MLDPWPAGSQPRRHLRHAVYHVWARSHATAKKEGHVAERIYMNRRMPAWLLLAAAPLLALAAAGSARQEVTQVLTFKPDDAAGRDNFEAHPPGHGADGGVENEGTVTRIARQQSPGRALQAI